jgi:hypothetical protein
LEGAASSAPKQCGIGFQPMFRVIHRQDADATAPAALRGFTIGTVARSVRNNSWNEAFTLIFLGLFLS